MDHNIPLQRSVHVPEEGTDDYWNLVDEVAAAIARELYKNCPKLTPAHLRGAEPFAIAALRCLEKHTCS